MIHQAPVGAGKEEEQGNYQCGVQSKSVKLPELLKFSYSTKGVTEFLPWKSKTSILLHLKG
jgi:hypothetical protein